MSVQAVIQSLEDLNSIHEKLLALGEQKQQSLIKNQVSELSEITNRESKLMKQVAEQEQLWLSEIANYLAAKGYAPNPAMTMTELIQLVYVAEDKQALLATQHNMLDTIAKLQNINVQNQQLIEQSLSFIDYTLDLMIEDPGQGITYQDPSKQAKSSTSKGLFDTKA